MHFWYKSMHSNCFFSLLEFTIYQNVHNIPKPTYFFFWVLQLLNYWNNLINESFHLRYQTGVSDTGIRFETLAYLRISGFPFFCINNFLVTLHSPKGKPGIKSFRYKSVKKRHNSYVCKNCNSKELRIVAAVLMPLLILLL